MNSANNMRQALLAVLLASCGESVCDQSARTWCQRVLGCNLIADDDFDGCVRTKSKRLRDLAATDEQCAQLQFKVKSQSCCEIAKDAGKTVNGCASPTR